MEKKHSTEYDGNIIIIDGSEASRKSILKKYVTDMVDYVSRQTGFYSVNVNIDVQYDTHKYLVEASNDGYVIKEVEIKPKPLEVDTQNVTLMIGQRLTLPIRGDYKKIEYTTDEWFRYNNDTITPILPGIHTLTFKVNNKSFEKTFIIVPQPEYVLDVNVLHDIVENIEILPKEHYSTNPETPPQNNL